MNMSMMSTLESFSLSSFCPYSQKILLRPPWHDPLNWISLSHSLSHSLCVCACVWVYVRVCECMCVRVCAYVWVCVCVGDGTPMPVSPFPEQPFPGKLRSTHTDWMTPFIIKGLKVWTTVLWKWPGQERWDHVLCQGVPTLCSSLACSFPRREHSREKRVETHDPQPLYQRISEPGGT